MIIRDRDILSYFSIKPYAVTPHLNHLDKTISLGDVTTYMYTDCIKLSLIITKYFLLSRALDVFGCFFWCFFSATIMYFPVRGSSFSFILTNYNYFLFIILTTLSVIFPVFEDDNE